MELNNFLKKKNNHKNYANTNRNVFVNGDGITYNCNIDAIGIIG